MQISETECDESKTHMIIFIYTGCTKKPETYFAVSAKQPQFYKTVLHDVKGLQIQLLLVHCSFRMTTFSFLQKLNTHFRGTPYFFKVSFLIKLIFDVTSLSSSSLESTKVEYIFCLGCPLKKKSHGVRSG